MKECQKPMSCREKMLKVLTNPDHAEHKAVVAHMRGLMGPEAAEFSDEKIIDLLCTTIRRRLAS